MKIKECKKGDKNQLDICKTCIKRGIFCFSPYKWFPEDFNIKSLTRGIISVDDCLLIMPELESKKVLKIREKISKLDNEIRDIIKPYINELFNNDESYNKMQELKYKETKNDKFIQKLNNTLRECKTSD